MEPTAFDDINATPLDRLPDVPMPMVQTKRDLPPVQPQTYESLLKEHQTQGPQMQPQMQAQQQEYAAGPAGQQFYQQQQQEYGAGQYQPQQQYAQPQQHAQQPQQYAQQPQQYAQQYAPQYAPPPQDYLPQGQQMVSTERAKPKRASGALGMLTDNRHALAVLALVYAVIMYAMPRLQALAPAALNSRMAWAATAAALVAVAFALARKHM